MNQSLTEIKPEQVTHNPYKAIGQDWMLVTAGTLASYNTMTASWGTVGVLWERPVCFCFVRPQRYTYEFMERSELFTLSFFEERYHAALDYCGSYSGRDVDKAKETGLTAVEWQNKAVYFAEASLVYVCRKIYAQHLVPAGFVDRAIEQQNYPQGDLHRMYIGEIVSCLQRAG
jgi:flavin reductase (DIM6/NTAB) family NADH-FMN oxidoreductase RutF